jgi:hypothetical protein
MAGLTRDGGNPVGDIGRYLAGTGNLMLAGAVAFGYGLRSYQGEPGLLVAVICILAGAIAGFQGVAAMVQFIRTAPNRALASTLAMATGLFALLGGGLVGAMLISIIGDAIFG